MEDVKRRLGDDDGSSDSDDELVYSTDEIIKNVRSRPISVDHHNSIYTEYLFDRDCGDHVQIGYKIVSYQENTEILPDPSRGIFPKEVDHSIFVAKLPKELPENMTILELSLQVAQQSILDAYHDGTLILRTEEVQSSSSSRAGMEPLSSSSSSSSSSASSSGQVVERSSSSSKEASA